MPETFDSHKSLKQRLPLASHGKSRQQLRTWDSSGRNDRGAIWVAVGHYVRAIVGNGGDSVVFMLPN